MNIYQYVDISIIKIFKSLSDENRLRIIRVLLNGYFNVNEIFYIVGGKQSNISHHLKILQDSALIVSKKEGSWIYYCINNHPDPKTIENIITFIRSEEKNIPFYEDDIKRLENILEKRKKSAENFFNNIGKELDTVQDELFKDIYTISDAIMLFEKKFENIIDIGCGTGKNLLALAKYADKVIGFDSSPAMLHLSDHICKINNLNYELKLGDIHKMPFSPNSLSAAFINMVLHHLSDPAAVMKEVAKILKEKGLLVMAELLSHNDEVMREKFADLWLGFTKEEIYSWLSGAGFLIKKEIIKENKKYKIMIIAAVKTSMLSR